MAKDVGGNPWVFDTAAQSEGKANYDAGDTVVHQGLIHVSTILIDAGAAGGTFEVKDKSGGRSLTGSLVLAANSDKQIVVGGDVEGIYIEAIADGQILVYHSTPR